MSDIQKLQIKSTNGSDSESPTITFEIQLSSEFSNLSSISLLYWLVNNQQTWISIPRDQATGEFKKTVDIGKYGTSGQYSVRSINLTSNKGTLINYNEGQLNELGFSITTKVENANSDNTLPTLNSLEITGSSTDADGNTHVNIQVKASDDKSGLKNNFIIEFLSPTGKSLQQWCSFDSKGESSVDFLLNKNSASGNYTINTVRIADVAGNNQMSGSFLSEHPKVFSLNNINSDASAPELKTFSLAASYDPITNRPQINISGQCSDLASGVEGVYLRLTSPSGKNLDKWVYTGRSQEANFSQ